MSAPLHAFPDGFPAIRYSLPHIKTGENQKRIFTRNYMRNITYYNNKKRNI